MSLNDRQRILAQAKAKGATDVEACKEACYKARTTEASCNQVARMMRNDEFKAYYDELCAKTESEAIMSRKDILETLTNIAKADMTEDTKDRIKAMENIAKLEGFNEPEKVETSGEITIIIGGDAN